MQFESQIIRQQKRTFFAKVILFQQEFMNAKIEVQKFRSKFFCNISLKGTQQLLVLKGTSQRETQRRSNLRKKGFYGHS